MLALKLELKDEEIYHIGMIVVHWAALEHEVFTQARMSFDDCGERSELLPKDLNNAQFTQTLDIWKRRVVDTSGNGRKEALESVHAEIVKLKEFRDALAHGMCTWSPDALDRITTERVKNGELIAVHFTTEGLSHFANAVACLNFRLRYPSGEVDLFSFRESSAVYFSRVFLQSMADASKKREDGGVDG